MRPQPVTFTAKIEGAQLSDSDWDKQWYIDAQPCYEGWGGSSWNEWWNQTEQPCVAFDGAPNTLRHTFTAPVFEDPWSPGYIYVPEYSAFRVYYQVRHKVTKKTYLATLYVSVQSIPTSDNDCVVSDAPGGPDQKVVYYSLPKKMDRGYLAIYSREAPGRPPVYRQALDNADLSKGVHQVLLSDLTNLNHEGDGPKVIGEDCWGKVWTSVGGEVRVAEDQMWMFTDGNGVELPHGSAQWARVFAGGSMKIQALHKGKEPYLEAISWILFQNDTESAITKLLPNGTPSGPSGTLLFACTGVEYSGGPDGGTAGLLLWAKNGVDLWDPKLADYVRKDKGKHAPAYVVQLKDVETYTWTGDGFSDASLGDKAHRFVFAGSENVGTGKDNSRVSCSVAVRAQILPKIGSVSTAREVFGGLVLSASAEVAGRCDVKFAPVPDEELHGSVVTVDGSEHTMRQQVIWLSDILASGDSTPRWQPSSGCIELCFEYRKMPRWNSDFGKKLFRLALSGGAAVDSSYYLFYPREPDQHPDSAHEDDYGPYMYWSQTYRGDGLDSEGRPIEGVCSYSIVNGKDDSTPPKLCYTESIEGGYSGVYRSPESSDDGKARIYIARKTYGRSSRPSSRFFEDTITGENGVEFKVSYGADNAPDIVNQIWAHEHTHYLSDQARRTMPDGDGDRVPDAWERDLGLDPTKKYTFGRPSDDSWQFKGSGGSDFEFYAYVGTAFRDGFGTILRKKPGENAFIPVPMGDYHGAVPVKAKQNEDWSEGGYQWKVASE